MDLHADPTIQIQNQNQDQEGTTSSVQETDDHQVIVVMVPLPAQGHLNQLLHLSRLISSYNIPVHYVATATHIRQVKIRVQGWDPLTTISNIHFHDLPVPPYETPPPNPNATTKATAKYPSENISFFKATVHLHVPIYKLLQQLSTTTRRLVVIHDSFMAGVIQDMDLNPKLESYSFHGSSAFNYYSLLWELYAGRPTLPAPELLKPLQHLPSLESFSPTEVLEQLKQQEEYSRINSSGKLYNTCRAIESPYLDLLAEFLTDREKQWAIGPFNPVATYEQKNPKKRHYCLEWLDKQAPNSVIYISFGTSNSISDDEAKEIAVGLEKSEQKFLWVLRDADKVNIFDEPEGGRKQPAQLPEGFEERNQERGIVVRDWAPQLEILGHSSTGGFLSHCGWNSCLESISMGVPVAAWPMHFDQPRNSILMEKVLKIAFVMRDLSRPDEFIIITSVTIENGVRRLMDSEEGKEMRRRAEEFSKKVKESVMEGGDSRLEMDSFIAHIRR